MANKALLSDKAARHWERARIKGMWRYILVHGVLLWGLSVGVGSLLFLAFAKRNGEVVASDSLSGTVIHIAGFCLAGLLFSYLQWRAKEKIYQRHLAEKGNE
ncbi:MAG: hypothetical protein AAF632_09220 [Bacteroidota bacterium]